MVTLKGGLVYLRALEPEDLDFLYELENNTGIWEISGTITPYSRHVLKLYLENAHRDIFEVKQLRLCICDHQNKVIGLIDLFEFDPNNLRAGIGIVIMELGERNMGRGGEAIDLLCDYAFKVLNLRQVYANVGAENEASIHLFLKKGFQQAGIKRDWQLFEGSFRDVILFQKFNT